ncbi:MAG: acyl-protein synthase, partial [Cyanobacteria bacterium REEB65]|nr:acyl-protein synthase [Cyanobacteria bacterium REEB65]
RLHPRSFVHTGGGWKKSEHEAIDKAQLRAMVQQAFGIPEANIRDGYGLVEHSVPYIECEQHRLHVSAFARAIVRDVETLAPLPAGAVGFLELLTPYIRSMPAHSLLTADLAAIGRQCPCGRQAPWIDLKGRAGIKKNKGCAIAAAETLLTA